MINLKILSTVAAIALVLPMTASFAAPHGRGGGGGGRPAAVGHGGGMHVGGGGGARFSGGGGYRGGYRGGGGGGGFIPGAVAGALVGGAIAAGTGYGYYGDPGYDQGYYNGDPGYYDNGAMAAEPAPAGDDAVGYCVQRFRSYDPASGTYLGNDGYRHPCP